MKRIVYAPPHIGFIPNVYTYARVRDDEEVIWFWTHHTFGSYISGYKIEVVCPKN